MDAISLYQRGITNVVASLGTALTEAQGRMLRKYANEIIIGYDSDGAGQAATMRGLEILSNLGYDIRVLQLEGAKDPDEFVIKYGTGQFNNYVENAISLVEFKIKALRKNLNLEIASDKIKFLNEVSKILAKVENNIEKEVYIDKISSEYEISKEAIYAQTNKLLYSGKQMEKILERPKILKTRIRQDNTHDNIDESIVRRENMIISLLLNPETNTYARIKDKISPDDFKLEKNKNIVKILYDEFEKGNSNINNILDSVEDEEIIKRITSIMVDDYNIADIEKAIIDILNIYEKERIIEEKNNILKKLEDEDLTKDEIAGLEKKLSEIIIKLAKMK